MAFTEKANLIIYRFREKGLEVFLLNSQDQEDQWQLPQGKMQEAENTDVNQEKFIALDPVHQEDGDTEQGFAMEGDWHDIPSLKSMVIEDLSFVKDQIKQMIPDMMEKGTFFAAKETFKRVLPHQYKMIKELKDILMDRNSITNI